MKYLVAITKNCALTDAQESWSLGCTQQKKQPLFSKKEVLNHKRTVNKNFLFEKVVFYCVFIQPSDQLLCVRAQFLVIARYFIEEGPRWDSGRVTVKRKKFLSLLFADFLIAKTTGGIGSERAYLTTA